MIFLSQVSPPLPGPLTSALALSLFLVCSACGSAEKVPMMPPSEAKALKPSNVKPKAEPAIEIASQSARALPWAESTYSPQPGSVPEPELELAMQSCGTGDAALHHVAQWLADTHQKEGKAPSLDFANFHLRRLGSPYVMPRVWYAQMTSLNEEMLAKSIATWANARRSLGERRCGMAFSSGPTGSLSVAAIQVDVLADVQPLPTQINSGEWVELSASFLTPTSSASVLLLPPDGLPRHLDTKVAGDDAFVRFSIETSGTWLVQLMATGEGGPRPVAEMLVTGDDAPPTSMMDKSVPGEEVWADIDKDLPSSDILFALINAARHNQGLPELVRNRSLDRVAANHSFAMSAQGRISHNTGLGDPNQRILEAGIKIEAAGENVALARSVIRLHRALWASPAHRENLLLRRWNEVGVAITKHADGTLFATQLFVDSD